MSGMPHTPLPNTPSAVADFGATLAEGFASRIGALAERLGADPASVRWVRRAAFAASRATSAGHVCVPLVRLARRYGAPLAQVSAALAASGVVSDGSEDASALRPLVVDADGRLYLARYFDYERQLAAAIVGRAAHTRAGRDEGEGGGRHAGLFAADARVRGRDEDLVDSPRRDFPEEGAVAGGNAADALEERLARYFGPPSAGAMDWQRAAAALALAGRLTVVSGGPGTGKTTTVVGILACLVDADPTLSIALAAPTGKAAQRMAEALAERAATLPPEIAARLPKGAQTLHRLLGAGQGGRPRHHRDNPLPFDVLVVDEASMIDVALAAQLFDALAPETRLVVLGDKDQLAAVEAGAVFAELSARPSFSANAIARMARAMGLDEASVAAALPGRDDALEHDARAAAFDDDALFAIGEQAHDVYAAAFEGIDDGFEDLEVFEGVEAVDVAAAAGSVDRQRFGTSPNEPPAGAVGGSPGGSATAALDADADADADANTNTAAPPQPHRQGQLLFDAPVPVWQHQPQSAAALVDSVIWLQHNYRFGLDSTIGRLSLAIRRGDAEAALAELSVAHDQAPTSSVAVIDEDTGVALAPRTIERLARGFSPYAAALAAALDDREPDPAALVDALNAYRVLCAMRVGARGVDALNALMAAAVRRAARVPLVPGTVWFAGRPVMVARNDYALGLFNGDVGVTLPGAAGALRVYFRAAGGGWRAVAPAALPPHDTAFALTVHKSQGSEFDEAALVLPASTSRALSRELVYTALTRARVAVRIVGARAALAAAIATPTRRDSGLAARMAEALVTARDR